MANRLAKKAVKDGEKAFNLTDATDTIVTEFSPLPHRPTTVLGVLTVQPVTAPTFRFISQTARDNNAAVVAAGGTKRTSTYGLESRDRSLLLVIAHLSDPVDKYLLQDVSTVSQFLANELTYGL